MARERVVRLVGTDAEIRAAAVLASAVIAEDPERARRLFPGIGRLGYDRRAYVRALAHPGAGSGSEPGDEVQYARRGSAVWGVIVGVGLVGVLISAAVFAPPIRGFHADPELGIPAAAVGSIVAVIALTAAIALRRLPSRIAAYYALACAAVVAGLTGLVVIYRALVGPESEGMTVTATQLTVWFVATALQLGLLLTLVLVLRRRSRGALTGGRRSGAPAADPREARRLIDEAESLVRLDRPSSEHAAAWESALGGLVASPAVVQQARALGPVAWLVWAFYDGELDVSGIRVS